MGLDGMEWITGCGTNKPRIGTPDYVQKFSVSAGHRLSPSAISIESSFSARADNVELPLSGFGGLSLDISPLEIIWS